MELHERIASVRKAKGLTQEQLGELVDVSRQAVSKWESGQTVPDALTIARLCEKLDVSADYILLGREPEERAEDTACEPAECPCCGATVAGSFCPSCEYPLPAGRARGSRYALVTNDFYSGGKLRLIPRLEKYLGLSHEEADALALRLLNRANVLLRRELTDDAARWLAGKLSDGDLKMHIVEDLGEPEEELTKKGKVLNVPEEKGTGLTFWGVVGAVVVALLILSFF